MNSDVSQIEIHTSEHLVPDLSRLEVQMATEKLKRMKLSGSDHIPLEIIQV
jgi:hypothetical protein